MTDEATTEAITHPHFNEKDAAKWSEHFRKELGHKLATHFIVPREYIAQAVKDIDALRDELRDSVKLFAIWIPEKRDAYRTESGWVWTTSNEHSAKVKAEHTAGTPIDAGFLQKNFEGLKRGTVRLP